MASIPKDIPEQNAPDYLNASKGTDKARAIADTSMGELFKDVGNLVTLGAKAGYTEISEGIRKNLDNSINGVRTDFGVDAATKIAESGASPTDVRGDASNSLFTDNPAVKSAKGAPPGVAKVGNAIGSLQEAYNQGKLSESYYNARLMAIVKEAKANNPGFSEEVDHYVQQIAGINPANALRKSLLSDLDLAERARQASMSKDETYLNSHLQYMNPGTRESIIKGDRSPGVVAQAKWEAAGAQSREFELQQKMHTLELADKANKYDQTQALTVGTQAVDDYVNKRFLEMSDGTGGVSNIQKMIATHGDKPWREDELQVIRSKWNELRMNTLGGVDTMLAQPAFAKLDPTKKKELRDGVIGRLDVVEKAITDKDVGVLASNANYVKAIQDRDMRTVLESNEFIRKQSAVMSLPGGKEYWSQMYMHPDSGMVQKGVAAIKDLDKLDLATGSKSLGEILQRRGDLGKTNPAEKDPEAYKRTMDDAVTGLTKSPSVEIAENHARMLFGDRNANFLSKFAPASQARVYGTLTSPEVTKKMIELGKTQPELFNNYQKWATDNFNTLFRSKLQDVSGEARWGNSPVTIRWDEGTSQFVTEINPGQKNTVLNTRRADYDALAATVKDINTGLGNLSPILKAGKGDVNQVLLDVLHANGWKDGAKDPGLLQRLGDAVKGALTSMGATGDNAEGATAFAEGKAQKPTYSFDSFPEGKSIRSDYAPPSGDLISLDGFSGFGTKAAGLKAVIRAAESSDNYNSVFGTKGSIDLSKMTLNDVYGLQDDMKRSGSPSTAVGGYQFLQRTLRDLQKELKLSGDEKFTPELQERLADALLQRRGYGDYLSGKIGHKDLVNRLAQEWAGLPTTEGRSFYDGDGLNKSTVKLRNVLSALKNEDS